MAEIVYCSSVSGSDPSDRPVTILGKKANLSKLQFRDVAPFLGSKVSAETWSAAVGTLREEGGSCSLWLTSASVAALPTRFSRHNTPSQAHSLTKLVQAERKKGRQTLIIVVCERGELLASGCAVARAFPTYSSKTASTPPQTVTVGFIVVGGGASPVTDDDIKCLSAECEGIRLAAEIVDAPANEMHTDTFIEKIQEVAGKLGLEPPLVIQGEELREKGFGGIYGVGKAAEHKPALVVLSHTPSGAKETIAWCGKGIVYDTGGLSIKGKTNMPGMKRDCGGAAAILGAFYTAVRLGFSQKLHAVFCLAENSVGPLATRPDDIHTLFSGKTVEINNTDAEGRLVLGDGVAYARKVLKAEWVVDLATLTGAQGISTGKYHAGILSNCEDCQKAIFEAGRTCGDLNFPLPYCPELHFREFDSAVADMKNSVMNRANAQSSCAGLFIGAHLGFDYEGVWIHVDMASPVYSGERATGYGVALLTTLYGSRSANPLLQSSAPYFNCEEKYRQMKAAKSASTE
jgi:probable aminopeptidase NPEPL1